MHTSQSAVCLLTLLIGSVAVADDRASIADAAEQSDRKAIQGLLEKYADVDVAQTDGMTALHWAAYRDDLDTAKLLVKAGANVNAKNRYEVTPLALACVNGNTSLVEMLLASGADANLSLRGAESPLMIAARTGVVGPVQALLNHGAKIDSKDRRGQTASMWAAAEGNAEVVKTLIEAGADFRAALDSGYTPLFFAVREGQTSVVRVLLGAGADVNETMQPRKTSGNSPIKGTSPLILAVENGHFELAVELLKAGADPNDQRSGFTALHNLTWVRKPNRGDEGDPAPVGSGDVSSLDLVRKLAAHKADVNARLTKHSSRGGAINKVGATPFFMAAVTADVPLMKLLVELGADPLLANADGTTPLMVAAGVGTRAPSEEAGTEPEVLEAVAYILSRGGDVNTVDKNGETAMHGAAYKSLPLVVHFLTDKGAKLDVWNHKNKSGWTPLLIAEGFRPGNYKPSVETIAAIHQVMRSAGVTPPPRTLPTPGERKDYVP